jgi:hypothetical protein
MERSRIFYLHFEHIPWYQAANNIIRLISFHLVLVPNSLSTQPTQATPKEVAQAPPPPQQQSGEGVAFNDAMPVAAAPGYPYAMTHAGAAAGGQGMSFIMQVSQLHLRPFKFRSRRSTPDRSCCAKVDNLRQSASSASLHMNIIS